VDPGHGAGGGPAPGSAGRGHGGGSGGLPARRHLDGQRRGNADRGPGGGGEICRRRGAGSGRGARCGGHGDGAGSVHLVPGRRLRGGFEPRRHGQRAGQRRLAGHRFLESGQRRGLPAGARGGALRGGRQQRGSVRLPDRPGRGGERDRPLLDPWGAGLPGEPDSHGQPALRQPGQRDTSGVHRDHGRQRRTHLRQPRRRHRRGQPGRADGERGGAVWQHRLRGALHLQRRGDGDGQLVGRRGRPRRQRPGHRG
jgi:hypothetical protein